MTGSSMERILLMICFIGYSSSVKSSALNCCGYLKQESMEVDRKNEIPPEFHVALISCVNSTTRYPDLLPSRAFSNSKIAIAMFASSHVYSFASFSSLLMSLYAYNKSYDFRLLNADTGDNHSNHDMRWNKVKSTSLALHPKHGWARDFDALVYADADLAVLEFSLDLHIYLSKYSTHDLIMSADTMDVGNTGFFIVRNTDWARKFLALWWFSRDSKFTFCDQHVLNKMYHGKKEWRQRIKILPSEELNSIWPAVENFQPNHRVLHLMGELKVYRDIVFENLSRTVCRALASRVDEHKIEWDLLPRQLNVGKEVSISLQVILFFPFSTMYTCRLQ